jgi:hypothetical protein
MSNLLETAVTAHGGLDRWNQVKSITVDASITGAFWYVKNQGDALKDIRFEVDTTRQRLDYRLRRSRQTVGLRARPSRDAAPQTAELIDARDEPEKSFDGHRVRDPVGRLHLAYFVGEALWTYLNTPFLYTWPGVRHRRDRPHRGRRRNVAAAEGDVPRSHQEPHPRADLVLRPGRAAAPARLHHRRQRRGARNALRHRLPRRRRHHHPHHAAGLAGRRPLVPAVAIDMGEITIR